MGRGWLVTPVTLGLGSGEQDYRLRTDDRCQWRVSPPGLYGCLEARWLPRDLQPAGASRHRGHGPSVTLSPTSGTHRSTHATHHMYMWARSAPPQTGRGLRGCAAPVGGGARARSVNLNQVALLAPAACGEWRLLCAARRSFSCPAAAAASSAWWRRSGGRGARWREGALRRSSVRRR